MAPDPVAGAVELVILNSGHRGAGAGLGDPVVGLGRVDAAMAHEFAQHLDWCARVGVPLGVGVPVAVGNDHRVGEHPSVGQLEHRQLVDPAAVQQRQPRRAQ
ncbi:hypothetical protein [Kribbella pittospori]|uniref:hypothetical protein n=1 Tax=Kribbella pittospori TaxID=722689 RepID=UPI0013F43CC5|nr:hypothetical protein [Kribbella pittospori]